jgi:hypothetical protein
MDSTTLNQMREVVEKAKRVRAMQTEYFRTRNLQTLRSCQKAERELDRLLEEMEKKLDEF